MKFDYCKETSLPGCGAPSSTPYTYHFQFSLSCDEVRKVTHKYAFTPNWMSDVFEYSPTSEPYQMLASLRILQDVVDGERVDLGINYKEKYDELVELLKPYKIEDDMSPSTTLKMILKYAK
jgi:hypothetical protein